MVIFSQYKYHIRVPSETLKILNILTCKSALVLIKVTLKLNENDTTVLTH